MGKKIEMNQVNGLPEALKGIKITKPILLIKFPINLSMYELDKASKRFDGSEMSKEYHVIEVLNNSDKFEIEVFSAINATDIDIEKLKEEIMSYPKLGN